MTKPITITDPDHIRTRLMQKVSINEETGCWDWTASKSHGYGRIRIGSRSDGTRRLAKAPRLSYELFVGPIPAGLTLDHLCRNRGCINPDHLEPCTNRENLRRGIGFPGENARKTHCKRGHEFTPENTMLRGTQRNCRTCHAEKLRRRYRQRRLSAEGTT